MMSLLLTIQSAITAATPWLASAAFVFALMSMGARLVERKPRCEAIAQFKRLGLLWQIMIVLSVGSATRWAGAKGDRSVQTQPSKPPQVVEPSIAPVAVYTNGISFVATSTNAIEVSTWRTIGGTEMGVWIESPTNAPFFVIGTTPISRAYASASGAISFESMRRPPVSQPLPDGTRLPVLCPLRTPLGFVPEANWPQLVGQDLQDYQDFPSTNNPANPVNPVENPSFWHDALPGGGRVFTWENALVDRFPNRRVSMQVEMRPSGDCVFRYDFQDELNPPATNFVIGAQMGTNGVNALSILGTNLLSATIWNVDGAPVTNGVPIADLLCTNGVLRTPASFEIRWKNTSGLDSVADSDGDGLTDWEEGGAEYPFCSICNCYGHQDADLDIYPRTLTLKHDNQAAFTLSHPNSPGVTYTDVRFEICQPGYGGWQTIAGNRWTARIAGTFNVRALANADGEPITVGPATIWVQFPSETEMMADPAIQAHAANLWTQTLALCTPTNRHEVGCWILLNTATDTYSFTVTTNGPPTPNNEDSIINLLPLPSDVPLHPNITNGAATYTVASFHTHTPSTYVSGRPRIVGASPADTNASETLLVPGLVYDYVENSETPGEIPAGHPMNAPAQLYPTVVCPRRTRQ